MKKEIFACADRVARIWLNNCENLTDAVKTAMKLGYGFVVKYEETGDHMYPWKLKVIGWKFHLVDYVTALGLLPKNDQFLPFYEDAHRRAPEEKFLVATSPDGPMVFSPREFDGIEELPLARYKELLQSA